MYRKATNLKYRENERTTNNIINISRMDKKSKSVRLKDGELYEPTILPSTIFTKIKRHVILSLIKNKR